MDYLKSFEQHSDYELVKNGMPSPSVAYCENEKDVHYRKPYDAEVEYLENNNTGTTIDCYIDTGFKHNQNTRFVFKMSFASSVAWACSFGSYGGAKNSNKLFCDEIGSDLKLRTYYGPNSTVHNFGITANGIHTYDLNKRVHKIDNTTYTFPTATFQSEFNDYLFAVTNYSGAPGGGAATKKRIYYFKIYDNGVLVRDFIPVRKNGVGYMYDKVEGKLYGNNGSGAFIIGPNIES